MKNSAGVQLSLCTFLILIIFQPAYAIGFWINGEVEKAPYHEDGFRSIQVDQIMYTVMEQAKIQKITRQDGAEYKTRIDIDAIRKGDEVLIQVEGNRIYQIEVFQKTVNQ